MNSNFLAISIATLSLFAVAWTQRRNEKVALFKLRWDVFDHVRTLGPATWDNKDSEGIRTFIEELTRSKVTFVLGDPELGRRIEEHAEHARGWINGSWPTEETRFEGENKELLFILREKYLNLKTPNPKEEIMKNLITSLLIATALVVSIVISSYLGFFDVPIAAVEETLQVVFTPPDEPAAPAETGPEIFVPKVPQIPIAVQYSMDHSSNSRVPIDCATSVKLEKGIWLTRCSYTFRYATGRPGQSSRWFVIKNKKARAYIRDPRIGKVYLQQ